MATHAKPGNIATFVKGKLLGMAQGTCATLNWLVSCLCFLKAGDGVDIEGLASGQPKISAKLKAGPGVEIKREKDGTLKITTTIIKGDDTNVVLTPVEEGPDKGSIKLDVYYN